MQPFVTWCWRPDTVVQLAGRICLVSGVLQTLKKTLQCVYRIYGNRGYPVPYPWSTISFPVVALSQLKPLLSSALLICDLPLKTQGLIVCEVPLTSGRSA